MAHRLEVLEGGSTVWPALRAEAAEAARSEPALASLMHTVILSHGELSTALSFQLGRKLGDSEIGAMTVREVCAETYAADDAIVRAAQADLQAVIERDPATRGYLQPFLFYKGFLALQVHRVSHRLWRTGRETLALHFQSRMSELFQVDIHPAARIGSGVFVDHGTGVVIGETASVGDEVSMLHGVTLGGTGAQRGDRHPKIGKGVLLGAGAKVLGNIEVGEYAKVAAGSVVLKAVPPHCTVAGVPAKLVNCPTCDAPAKSMDHTVPDLGDYVI
jgi:serine O-acetyltransferase